MHLKLNLGNNNISLLFKMRYIYIYMNMLNDVERPIRHNLLLNIGYLVTLKNNI